MRRWPDFFIIGAGRAGTTSLYYYLRGHPNIYLPSLKEPHFFSTVDYRRPAGGGKRQRTQRPAKVVKREADYLRLFADKQPHQLAGEASVTYLSDKDAPTRIKKKAPEAKIIAVLRDPVERAYSQYLLDLREGREWRASFYDVVQEDSEYLAKHQDAGSFYIWPGLYHQHVSRYVDTFGREHVRIYRYEDLAADTTALVEDLCAFLGVPFSDGSFFDPGQKYHAYGSPRNAVFGWMGRSRTLRSCAAKMAPMHWLVPVRDRLIDRQQAKPPLDPRARDVLRSIYHDDILKLQELMGRDLSSWLTEDTGVA
jgi:hypothetical protein